MFFFAKKEPKYITCWAVYNGGAKRVSLSACSHFFHEINKFFIALRNSMIRPWEICHLCYVSYFICVHFLDYEISVIEKQDRWLRRTDWIIILLHFIILDKELEPSKKLVTWRQNFQHCCHLWHRSQRAFRILQSPQDLANTDGIWHDLAPQWWLA